jgi:hypothetical protein
MQVIEGVFLANAWGDGPPVAAFVAWATLCDVFVKEQQLASDKRRALLLNPVLHALQAPPLGATPAVRMVPAPAAAAALPGGAGSQQRGLTVCSSGSRLGCLEMCHSIPTLAVHTTPAHAHRQRPGALTEEGA